MVHLITLNPAVDEFVTVDNFQIGSTNYSHNKKRVIGGKAVNVANILTSLKQQITLVTTYEKNNQFIFEQLSKYNSFLIEVDKTRVNLKINDKGKITEINERGSKLPSIAKLQFENYINKCVEENDIVLIAGNPHQEDEQFQFKLATLIKRKNARLFVDSNKFTAQMIDDTKPEMIKPNDDELQLLLDENLTFDNLQQSVHNIIVSHGADGFTYHSKTEEIRVMPLSGEVINTVGAGDSLVAGYIYGVVNNLSTSDALQVANICACATVFNEDIATYEQIIKLDENNILK